MADNDDARKELFNRAVSLTQEIGLDYLEIREEENVMENCKVKNLYYGFKKKISSDNEQNLKAIPRKSRRMVRKGMKNDLCGTFGHVRGV